MRASSRSQFILSALLMVLPTLPGCGTLIAFKAREQRTLTTSHVANTGIRVTTQNGSVQITADPASREVVIEATITASGDSQEEADRRLALVTVDAQRLSDGTLDISSTFPEGRRSNDSCSLEITLPEAVGAEVDSSNGNVTLVGLDGNANVHTSNGSVRIEHQGGAIIAQTSNGRIVVEQPGDSVDVRTSNGSVEIDGFTAAAKAKTSNGSVTCRADAGTAGPITINTSNGSVRLIVPSSVGGVIEASTSNGGITVVGAADVTGSKGHRSIRLSQSGPNSSVETSNGHVTITIQAADAAAPSR